MTAAEIDCGSPSPEAGRLISSYRLTYRARGEGDVATVACRLRISLDIDTVRTAKSK